MLRWFLVPGRVLLFTREATTVEEARPVMRWLLRDVKYGGPS